MKGKTISKILVVLLAIMMLLPLSEVVASAEEVSNTNTVPEYIQEIYRNGRTPEQQADYDSLKWQMQLESDIGYIRNYVKEQEKFAVENKSAKARKKSLEKVQKSLKVVKDNLPGFISVIKDASNGGDFDTAQVLNSVFTLASDIASCCGPYGQIAAGAIALVDSIFTAIMGGESATKDLAQMEDRLNQQLDDIQNQLSEIEEQINGLSDKINESTNRIISEVTTAIDNADAKQYLRTFILSGEGNFSYNEYKNYIYGTIDNNSKSNTAYYSWLKYYAQKENSEAIVKNYYDLLYKSLIDGWHDYHDYIIGAEAGKSIVQYYYDVVSANPDLLKNSDMSPELAAIMFAYDIYQTELMVDQLISTCNFYQYTYFLLYGSSDNGKDYVYDKNNANGFCTREQLEWSISEQINGRLNEIESQLAFDVAYILNLDDSYIVESIDGNIYEVVNSNPDTYGKVLVGQTIYLNSVPQEICKLFEFETSDFNYALNVPTSIDGVFLVDSNVNHIQASLCYKGEELNTLSFCVGTNTKFNGGNGTASDPYLIASAAQFASISNGLDKHYRLICDIDFNGATINPIGQKVNSNNAIVYDEFVGSLDGNGYMLSNLNVVGHTNAGLFGIIGEGGEVADLKLYDVKVSANITNAERSTSEFYAGMIAGKNNGIIKYCSIDSDGTIAKATVANDVGVPCYGLSLEIDNETNNRNIYAYAGGIAGSNNYAIVGCSVTNSFISASSTHNFGGDATSTNKNNVYIGGICGYSYGAIAYSIVNDTTKISSCAKSIYNPKSTVNPYVVAHAGGIVAKVDSLNNIYQVESEAEIISNEAVLDCESLWGEHYRNCSEETNSYIPNYSADELKAIIATESVKEFIAKTERNYVVTFDCSDTVYEAGSDAFNTENLVFFINGIEKEYEIINVYGFNAQNEKFDSVSQNIVILFSVEIGGNAVYFAQDLNVTIKENAVTSIEVLNLKDSYVTNTFSLEGLVIKYDYAVGSSEYITINSENISQVKLFGNISTFGKQSIALLYNGDTVEFEINVVCGHANNFTDPESGYLYDESLSHASTCIEIGYNAYVCSTCGDVQYFYLRKVEHTPDLENVVDAKEASCLEEGNTGKILCIDCGEVLINGNVIPKLNHNYVYLDEDRHVCSNGEHSEYHHYTVTESVKSKINADGSESWYIVYTYTCVCQKDGVIFSKEVVDENMIVDANTKLPTIMVSDGYALSAGDEVVVYVQLLNNPGINAANFGIRYSEGLELIKIQDGTVLKGSLVIDGLAVNYGYNFVWGNDSLFSNDGNLLKLTFKVSEYAELGDSFVVSLVYAIGNGAQGGFGTSTGKQYFITKDGTITIVERLPGDINNDGVVDLMDAIEIGRFVVGKTDSIDETYANVDLSYNDDGNSNVDIMDMVAILQYITGGYGTNLLTQDFEIILNTNGYNKTLNNLLVSIYGDNNTYDEAGLVELERQGYKFLGWYDQMVGGNLIDINGDVKYNSNQKKQTLYAHWELNKLVFDANDATSGEMLDVYYTEDLGVTVENAYKKEYNVAFISDNAEYDDVSDVLKYTISYWQGDNGKQYDTLDVAVEDLKNAHYGTIKLTAVWSESPALNYPDWLINGYENQVLWYGSANSSPITKINSNTDILNYALVNGYYMVYAKHTPIVYDIVFDFNGGSGTVAGSSNNTALYGYSIEKTYDLSRVSVSNVGNAFTAWAIYVDSVYYKDFTAGETIGYLPGAKQNSLITVKAVWNEKSYSITYVLNGGNLSDGEKISTYRISEIDEMKVPSPTYPTYSDYNEFVAWYVDKELTQKFDKATLKVNPENITLYAKWDLCIVYYITNTPQKITGNRVIVDWSSVSNGTYDSNRTIYTENVSQIYFVGNPNAVYNNLIISAYAGATAHANQLVHLNNFRMNGYLTKTDNSVNLNMTIDCVGDKNAINAPTETSAIVKFTSLTFTGTGNLSVTAGNGVNATTAGGNGTNGAKAIIVDNLTINMSSMGKLTVKGGDGGTGAAGSAGTSYSNTARGGEDGSNGGNGNNGGSGGDGGAAISAKSVNVQGTGIYDIKGGNGGNGAIGGAGGNGQQGGEVGLFVATGDSRKGGKGGTGGSGGFGGKGGDAIVVSHTLNAYSAITLTGGNGGSGGAGGNGGAGGKGGKNTWWFSGGGRGGTGGDGGTGGNGGASGNGCSSVSSTSISITNSKGTAGSGGNGGNGGAGGTGGSGASSTGPSGTGGKGASGGFGSPNGNTGKKG